MKKLMLINLILIVSTCFSYLSAQSISGQRNRVERLEKKIERQKDKIAKAEKEVQDEINRLKKEAEKNPKAHGVLKELNKLRDQVTKEKEKLKKLEEDLKKEKDKLEEKLNDALDDILDKYPIPEDPDKLDEYEEEMKKLETNPRNSETEAELRKRIQERIDAKRKELEEQSSVPEQQHQNFNNPKSNWERISTEEEPKTPKWSLGAQYTYWFTKESDFSDSDFEKINEKIYTDEDRFLRLFEKLGGEFFIGTFSAPGRFTNNRFQAPQFIGVDGKLLFQEHFVFAAGIAKGRSSVSSEFPVTIIGLEDGTSRSINGQLLKNTDLYNSYVQMQYILFLGYLQAVMGTGVDFQYSSASTIDAVIGAERFEVERQDSKSTIYPRVDLGLRFKLNERLMIEANIKSRKIEQRLELGAGLGLQYQLNK